jgi:hypothetical protein
MIPNAFMTAIPAYTALHTHIKKKDEEGNL